MAFKNGLRALEIVEEVPKGTPLPAPGHPCQRQFNSKEVNCVSVA